MKITTLILFTCLIQVNASSFGQRISLKQKNISVEGALREIRLQSGYKIIYDAALIERLAVVSVDLKNATVEAALTAVVQDPLISFEIIDNTIILHTKEKTFLDRLVARFQRMDVKGKITDSLGTPLSGATIKVKGKRKQTNSNKDGEFFLEDVDEGAILEITYVGYMTNNIAAAADLGTIVLLAAPSDLEEVVINAGYYKTTRKEATGNIGRVSSREIEQQPITNPLQALQGRMAGVYVEQASGLPGGGFTIRIRGLNSVNSQANEPLYVVDGVPYAAEAIAGQRAGIIEKVSSLNSIDAANIESIEVLKDADATAIYGSRGANGVVLITTKKGKAGKTLIEVNAASGLSEVANRMELLNTQQFVGMVREGLRNGGLWPLPPAYVPFFPVLNRLDSTRYTDWQEELIGGTANSNDAQAALSGGNSNTHFLFRAGYHRETTVFPVDFSYEKASGHFSFGHTSPNEKLNMAATLTYVTDNNKLPRLDLTSQAISLVPHAPALYDNEGNLNWENNTWFNPLAEYTEAKYKALSDNFVANTNISYKFFPSLEFKTSMGFNSRQSEDVSTTPFTSFRPDLVASNQASALFGSGKIKTWIIEPQLVYTATIGKGNITTQLGTSFQDTKSTLQTLSARGFASDALLENLRAAPTVTVSAADYYQYRYNAVFGRINYNIAGKYFVNLTGRRDGSSRFGPGKQFGNFGAVGVAWIFSKEGYIARNLPFISHGKLRGSYGVTGSDQIGNYRYLDTYTSTRNPYQGTSGLIPIRLANADYGWEKNNKLEIGLELGLINDRIFVAASHYYNRSSNQLIGYVLPVITGQASIQRNLPATVQNTGWEFEVTTSNIRSSNFEWNTSLNFTIPRNKLISFPNLETSPYATFYAIGRSLFNQYGYVYTGVNPETGFYSFEDVDGNGNISFPNDLQIIGEKNQKHYGGITNTIRFKGLQLDFLFQWVKQTGNSYIAGFPFPGSFSYNSNQPVIVLDRWQKPGDISAIQKFDINGLNYSNFNLRSDRTITDASFVRLKNAELAYQLPAGLIKNTRLQKAMFFAQGQNLLTFTDYLGLDPESQNNKILPPLRTINFGIRVTL